MDEPTTAQERQAHAVEHGAVAHKGSLTDFDVGGVCLTLRSEDDGEAIYRITWSGDGDYAGGRLTGAADGTWSVWWDGGEHCVVEPYWCAALRAVVSMDRWRCSGGE